MVQGKLNLPTDYNFCYHVCLKVFIFNTEFAKWTTVRTAGLISMRKFNVKNVILCGI